MSSAPGGTRPQLTHIGGHWLHLDIWGSELMLEWARTSGDAVMEGCILHVGQMWIWGARGQTLMG